MPKIDWNLLATLVLAAVAVEALKKIVLDKTLSKWSYDFEQSFDSE